MALLTKTLSKTVQKTVKLHRVQADFRNSSALYRAFVGGRGAGKSWVGAYDLIRRAKRDRLYYAVAPTFTMLADATFRTFLEIGRELGVIDPANVRQSPPSVRLSTGAEILFRSADNPDRLRGPNLSGVWLDEASLMEPEAYDIVLACLRQAGQQGWLSATFTPKGLTHWTHEYFGPGNTKPNTEVFHARTEQNPFNPPGFADKLAGQYVARQARQELGGEFVDTAGAEWPGEYFNRGIWFDDWPGTWRLRVIALDPSKGKSDKIADPKKEKLGDYSAFVMLQLDSSLNIWIDADLDQHRDTAQIVTDGLIHMKSFRPNGFAIEVNGFQSMFRGEFLRQAQEAKIPHLPLYMIENVIPKVERIRTLGTYLQQGKLHFKRKSLGAKTLVAQLQDFPVARYDDGPDALEMGIRLLIELWNGTAR